MIAFAAFNTFGGLGFTYLFYDERSSLDLRRLEGAVALANHDATMPNDSEGYYVVTRRILDGHHLTWIGVCRSPPVHWRKRPNDYVGVGLWISGTVLDGRMAVELLTPALAAAMRTLEEQTTSRRDPLESLAVQGVSGIERWQKPLLAGQGLAFDLVDKAVSFRVPDRGETANLPTLLDMAQTDPGLQTASKALIPLDDKAERGIRAPFWTRPSERVAKRSLKAAAPRALHEEPGLGGDPVDEWTFRSRRQMGETVPEDPHANGRSSWQLADRLTRVEGDVKAVALSARRSTAMAAGSLALGGVLAIGLIWAAWPPRPVVQPSAASRPTIPPTPEVANPAAPHPMPPPAPPRTGFQQEPTPPPMTEVRPDAGSEGDFHLRLEQALQPLASLAEATAAAPGESARRLHRPYQTFLDNLQQAPDPRIKTIAARLRAQFEQARTRKN